MTVITDQLRAELDLAADDLRCATARLDAVRAVLESDEPTELHPRHVEPMPSLGAPWRRFCPRWWPW